MKLNRNQWDAADILFFEVESPDGFLARFKNRQFDEECWQQLWLAVSRLLNDNFGQLDQWATLDLTCLVEVVQETGRQLIGRRVDSLDTFELNVISAISYLGEVLSDPDD